KNDNVVAQEIETSVNDVKNTVQYDTYRRVVGKLKSKEQDMLDMKEQINSLRNEKLEADGNKDQLIESLRKEVTETKTKLRTTVGSVARSQAMKAIVNEAVNAGCNSPEVVERFLSSEIENLTFDEDFNPDAEQVRELVEDAKKKAPVLFSKEAPRLANHNTTQSGGTAGQAKDVKKMSIDELMNQWGKAEN
ncbi:MAG: hypothetical protein DRQ40_09595, partial [Gammaproteobacteria bacterium]